MEKVERNFIDFCVAAQEDNELWKKLSKITDRNTLHKFFRELGFTIEPEHIEKIMVAKKDIEQNMNAESDKDYY